MEISLFLQLTVFLLIASLTFADEDSIRDQNPFSSTYQFWSPINNLAANSKAVPLYITDEGSIDLVVGSPNEKIQWYNNIRGLGKVFSPLPLSAHYAAEFTHVNFQSMNSSDIAYIEKSGRQLYIAKNPFRNGILYLNAKEQRYVEAWEEEVILDLDNEPSLHSDVTQDRIISSMLKVSIDPQAPHHQDFWLTLEDSDNRKNTEVIMLEKIPHKRAYKIGEKFTIPSSSSVKIASYIDLENKGTNSLILLIEGKLHAVMDSASPGQKDLKQISNIVFPTDYNFKHTNWVTLKGIPMKNFFFIHPETHQLGFLINTWNKNSSSYPSWEFIEIPHYSLQMKEEGVIKARDCIILYPEQDRTIFDFLCITDSDLRYYIQDQSLVNVTVPKNPSLTVKMNIFHDMPLHLIVWNNTLRNDHIYYLEPTDPSAFVLFSSSQGILSWVEKNKIALDSYEWTTNFWILIMLYCLFMSIIAGVIHSVFTSKYSTYKRDTALLDRRSPKDLGPSNQFPLSFGPNRRTTV